MRGGGFGDVDVMAAEGGAVDKVLGAADKIAAQAAALDEIRQRCEHVKATQYAHAQHIAANDILDILERHGLR
ncbi:hypothetical protein A5717_26200 [Mycolicibacterium porcinum]|uniref:hypothetical protein n=1 Tax=Mycolicibacterium porcinum TaxID=39693 RepID=UPI00080BB8D6|nr:hypothetical protein [Mycolicibacterium porcinum]OCB09269.1 hypothetical protein A5717_26200 [Mycolicibacterium porcinum]